MTAALRTTRCIGGSGSAGPGAASAHCRCPSPAAAAAPIVFKVDANHGKVLDKSVSVRFAVGAGANTGALLLRLGDLEPTAAHGAAAMHFSAALRDASPEV